MKNTAHISRMIQLVWIPIVLIAAPLAAQTGTGLTGRYYDDISFNSLKTTRTDSTIHFDWGSAIPSGTSLTGGDTFSVAWTGQIEPEFAEKYTFHLTADDGARLWIDDEVVVIRTFHQGDGEMRGQMPMKAGQRVNIRIEYMEDTGNAKAKLEWSSPSQTRQVVPRERLYPTPETPNGGSILREVWTGISGTSVSSITSHPNYPNRPASREFPISFECLAQNWEDNYGTRVTGFIRPEVSGTYTFAVSGDEVVQLFLSTDSNPANRTLVASTASATGFRQWDAQPSQQSAARTLAAGQKYYVEMLHKESTGTDHWSVAWKPPGISDFEIIPGTMLMMPNTELATPSSSNLMNTLATEQPRVGVTKERFLWLKQQYESPASSAVKTRAQRIVTLANGDLTANLSLGRSAFTRMQRLATAWWLTGDPAYAERAYELALHSANNGDWSSAAWKGEPFAIIGIAYDWLYPYWTSARRTTLLNAMNSKALDSTPNFYDNNLGMVSCGGYIIGNLAVGTGNESKVEPSLNKTLDYLANRAVKWQSNNGNWYEGTDYGIFAKLYYGPAMMAMESALGSTFAAGRTPGVSAARREPLAITTPIKSERFTYSDVGTGSEAPSGWSTWWPRRFNVPEGYSYPLSYSSVSPFTALMTPETTLNPATSGMSPDTCFRGPADSKDDLFQNPVTMRGNWTDSKTLWVGCMGGADGTLSHDMMQSGTFQLVARGKQWFVDLKSESYDVPYHNVHTPGSGRDRWDYYRNRAEGHNTFIVNPNTLSDRVYNNSTRASIVNYQSAPSGQRSLAVYDLTPKIKGATRAQRGFQLLNQRKHLLIQDEIAMSSPGTVWWFAHMKTSTTASIAPDGKSVMLTQGGERLWCRILGNQGVWTLRSATPLPGTSAPSEADPNTDYHKLAIQLDNVTNATLPVWFVPLAPGENPPAFQPLVEPLNSWNLSTPGPPTANDGGLVSVDDAPVSVDLRNHAEDDLTPAEQLVFAVGNAIGGTVELQPDGHTATFTPTPLFPDARSFTFTATDADGGTSNPGTIVVAVSPTVGNWTNLAGGSWSAGANWSGGLAPVSGIGLEMRFFDGMSLPASTTIPISNDLPGATTANRLVFGGTGATGSVVNLGGGAITLAANGFAVPNVQLAATGGALYDIANDITLGSDTTFDVGGGSSFVFNGALTGPGGLVRSGGSSTLILAGDNSYGGDTTISAGTLQIGIDGATGSLGNGQVNNDGTLRFDRSGVLAVPNTIRGAGGVQVNCPANSGTIELTGVNDFTGPVNISGGALRINNSAALGEGGKTITINLGTSGNPQLRLDGSTGPIILPPDFTYLTSNNNSGAIVNEAGDNRIAGTITLTTGGGDTRIVSQAGTLTIDANIAPGTGNRYLRLKGAGDGVVNGSISNGSGNNVLSGIQKSDAGTWVLAGPVTHTGNITCVGGTLLVNGNVSAASSLTTSPGTTLGGGGSINAPATIGGTVAPGESVGDLSFGNTVSFAATSAVRWEPDGNSLAGDRVACSGAVTVDAGARIDVVLDTPNSLTNFLNGFWRSPRSFPVVTADGLNGTFTLGTITADSAGQDAATYGSFALEHTATGVNLVWTPIPGFPVYDDPVITMTHPPTDRVTIADVAHSLRLSATASGGTISGVEWRQLSGPGSAWFDDRHGTDTRVSFSEGGTYVLRFLVHNDAGAAAVDLTVEVEPAPKTLALRSGLNGYSHAGTFIRPDPTTWNSGARNQIILGCKENAAYRGLLSFPLPADLNGAIIDDASLKFTIAEAGDGGTLGTLNLHRLLKTFVEGTGNGSYTSHGAGTGADWVNRNYSPATAWSVAGCGAGSDYQSSSLVSVPGFDAATAPVGSLVRFDGTAAFLSAIANAAATAQPLGLFVKMTGDTSGTKFIRLASDDHATANWRPELSISYYDHYAPIIDPGPDTSATVGTAMSIQGTVTRGSPGGWTLVDGPGPAFVTNQSDGTASVLFSTPGTHLMRLSGSNSYGETSRTVAVEVGGEAWTAQQIWRQSHFGTTANTGNAADFADSNNDGEANLLEFATGQNPHASTLVTTTLAKNGTSLDFTYARSLAAMSDGITFTVEWSDTLAPGSWNSAGVTEEILSDNGLVQSVKVNVADGTAGMRFLRLRTSL